MAYATNRANASTSRHMTRKRGRDLAMPTMTDTVEALILDLIEWVELKERTYEETMDAWRTSCPRFPVWEEANERGLVERAVANGRLVVRATPGGMAFLEERRPNAYAQLRQ